MIPLQRKLILLFGALMLVAGCASPEERFIEASVKSGPVTDREVLKCAAEKLKKQLGPEQFEQLIEELELIGAKKKSAADANVKLMGAMTVANGACAVTGAIDGLFGGGDKKP